MKPSVLAKGIMKLSAVLLLLLIGFHALAQTAESLTALEPPLRSPEELDQMLAPIALFPDPLLAAILPASTLPVEIVLADRYVMNGGAPEEADQQGWDSSVLALVWYPSILQWMDDNLPWTSALGQAFLAQPQDVFDAIQRLRARAQAFGNLPTTPEQAVLNDNGPLEILPATPDVIYLPHYQPQIVYCQSAAGGAPSVHFGAGVRLGCWLHHDIDWHGRQLMVWPHNHPRPADWWNPRFGQRPTLAAAQATVWHPRQGPGPQLANGPPGGPSGRGAGTSTAIGRSSAQHAGSRASGTGRQNSNSGAPSHAATSSASSAHSAATGSSAGGSMR